MEYPEGDTDFQKVSVDTSPTAVNSLILDYYKKFGRKRDLEQFFSLSTAQSEIRDPTGTFWRKMKSQNDSSDSGEKKSESSTELCRISIKCSVPEPSSFQKKDIRDCQASDSDSPPIITEDVAPGPSQDSDVESVKSDDVQSQRSNDATLDTSMNKPHSPTSSVTSQRKLEWDSLADVGYANESDRKNSASSLSTLERLALKQQYSHNDSRKNIELGAPTSHSTPVEETETKSKGKKGLIKKTTKIYQKDVDLVEFNVPHSSKTNLPQAISVNLSKHISFNVEKDGEVNIDNIKRNISVSPDKAVETDRQTEEKLDKEIQTSLIRNKDKLIGLSDAPSNTPLGIQKFPVLISLNTLKNKNRKKKLRIARQKLRRKSKARIDHENIHPERATEQVSDAESFEYMPGHIYNENHMKINEATDARVDNKSNLTQYAGNKSSLESSAGITTDSSRGSTFAKDLEKSVDLLKTILQQQNNDSTLKKKLIKEVVHRLIKSKYKDISSSTDFLSGLSVDSKLVGSEGNHTTTSTSDAGEDTKSRKPKKSILRTEIFNSQGIASTSQSAPNLPFISNIEKPTTSKPVFFSNTDSEHEIRESDKARTSSEELYKKYLEALRREEAYKKQIRNKENFLTQKVISSDTAVIQLAQADLKRQSKLKSLINDLTRNNYDDGSGDACKLEGHTNYNTDMHPYAFMNRQRSHSVFTLSSGNSNNKCKMTSSKNKNKSAIHDCKADFSKDQHHYCCCPYHTDHAKAGVTDSSVQVDIKCETPPQLKTMKDECRQITCAKCKKESPCDIAHAGSHSDNVDLKYVCMCCEGNKASYKVPEKFLIYKCSQLVNKSVQSDENQTKILSVQKDSDMCSCKQGGNVTMTVQQQCNCNVVGIKEDCIPKTIPLKQDSKSSQTNLNLNLMLHQKSSVRSVSSQSTEGTDFIKNIQSKRCNEGPNVAELEKNCSKALIHEAVRSIQTEISINPKLSDPGLSDINIIDDRDCVKVIGEHYKEKSKSNTETNTIDQVDKKACFISCDNKPVEIARKPCSEKEKNNIDNNCTEKFDKVAQSCLEPVENIDNKNFSDHFTIPIQGTNMTLKVNLATNDHDNVQPQNSTIKSQGVVTERMDVVEQFTSLRDDCTKSIQCCYPIVTTPFQSTNDINVESKNNKNDKQNDSPPDGNCCPVKAETNKKPKCNTFPKADHDNVRKPFLRTNTDPTNLEAVNLLQIDLQKHCKTTKCQKICSVSKDEPNISNNNVKFKEITDQDKCIKFKALEECCSTSAEYSKPVDASKKEDFQTRNQCKLPASSSDSQSDLDTKKDNLLDLIRDITKRYSKKDIEKSKRKKCFKEIMSVLSYLLDTEDSTDEQNKSSPRTKTGPCQKQDDSLHKKAKNIGDNRSPKSCTGPCQKQDNILRKKSPTISDDKSSPNSCSKPCQDQGAQRKSPNVIDDKSPPNSCRGPCQEQGVQRKSPNVIDDKSPPNSCRGPCQEQGVQRKSPNVFDDRSSPNSCSRPYQDQGAQRKSPNVIDDKSPPNSFRGPCQKQDAQRKSPNIDNKSSPDSCTRSSNSCSEKQGMPYKEDAQTISCCSKTFVDKGVQFCKQKPKSNKCRNTESSEMAVSTEFPITSSDSATCKVLNKIKKECERYHQKRCKSQNGFKPCETSSTTSVNCHQCKRIHHCHCMRHKCRGKAKTTEKPKKTCIAYNLILQTSDSAVSEDTLCGKNRVPLKSIIVKVPSKRRQVENVPFREMAAKLEKNIPCSPRQENRCFRSRSLPNESDISSTEDFLRKAQTYTVREYLERNRPDFVERCSKRQDCLKFVNETRATERNAKRKLLSLQLDRQKALSAMTDEELRYFAKQLSEDLRRKKIAPKFINEREMKKHSEKIYKSLPEVTRKKEELKKENVKKTNLLMANIFKKNLQKKALRGSVNLSNYSTVIKI